MATEEKVQTTSVEQEKKKVVTRIYVTSSGDLVVTDMWDGMQKVVSQEMGFEDGDACL